MPLHQFIASSGPVTSLAIITFMSRERLSAKNADLLGAYHEIIRFESKCIFIWLTLMCILLVGLTNS